MTQWGGLRVGLGLDRYKKKSRTTGPAFSHETHLRTKCINNGMRLTRNVPPASHQYWGQPLANAQGPMSEAQRNPKDQGRSSKGGPSAKSQEEASFQCL